MASNLRVAMDQKTPLINQDQTPQQQQQQQALKCPRCDSSNTKFCYYNNYSLTQPRHFCKACKRYWTRGGTLRNVPVGGGCRKNKRIKSRTSSNDAPSSSSSSTPTSAINPRIMNHHQVPHIDILSSSSNPNLFYGLPTTNPYPSFNSRVSSLNPLGLGFSSGLEDDYNRSGLINSNSFLSNYSMFGSSSSSSSSTTTSSPSMASIILASSLQQQKYSTSNGGFHGLIGAYENLQMEGPVEGVGGGGGGVVMNQTDQIINGSSDPSLYWNSTNVGAWLDPTNLGPSVPSLI